MNDAEAEPKRVLDASALLAVFFREVGFEVVPLEGSAVSAVNWAEVLQVAARRGADVVGLDAAIAAEGAVIVSFTPADAEAAAALWQRTRTVGLSLADRACLALAQRYGVPALTADRAWRDLEVGIEIAVVR